MQELSVSGEQGKWGQDGREGGRDGGRVGWHGGQRSGAVERELPTETRGTPPPSREASRRTASLP